MTMMSVSLPIALHTSVDNGFFAGDLCWTSMEKEVDYLPSNVCGGVLEIVMWQFASSTQI